MVCIYMGGEQEQISSAVVADSMGLQVTVKVAMLCYDLKIIVENGDITAPASHIHILAVIGHAGGLPQCTVDICGNGAIRIIYGYCVTVTVCGPDPVLTVSGNGMHNEKLAGTGGIMAVFVMRRLTPAGYQCSIRIKGMHCAVAIAIAKNSLAFAVDAAGGHTVKGSASPHNGLPRLVICPFSAGIHRLRFRKDQLPITALTTPGEIVITGIARNTAVAILPHQLAVLGHLNGTMHKGIGDEHIALRGNASKMRGLHILAGGNALNQVALHITLHNGRAPITHHDVYIVILIAEAGGNIGKLNIRVILQIFGEIGDKFIPKAAVLDKYLPVLITVYRYLYIDHLQYLPFNLSMDLFMIGPPARIPL